jgi:hypothetical protein
MCANLGLEHTPQDWKKNERKQRKKESVGFTFMVVDLR